MNQNPSDTQSNESSLRGVACPACHSSLDQILRQKNHISYCPFCGIALPANLERSLEETKSLPGESSPSLSGTQQVSIIQDQVPATEAIQFTIGPYQILRSIGKGGMGEVFLAYDTVCGRRIALKRIRTDLLNHEQLYHRFVREAHITSQLTHPSIIPIYAIHREENLIYYTMPYVEGETLKQILRKTRSQEKKGEQQDHLGGSIPALVRLFINICQAVAYAHSKNVLHRDLKPENIIIGKYGETLILDWGLAKLLVPGLSEEDSEEEQKEKEKETTPPQHIPGHTYSGKIVGTVSYMAPERAWGHPATVQTDIYSLGVMLYQILSLHPPFLRETLKEFQRTMHREKFIDPAEIAPYRDVPRMLSQIARKCLSPIPAYRYNTVEELIHELESYIEGRSEWFAVAELNIRNKADWEFQENVLIAEHIAITQHTEVSDWVNLMISKVSVVGNTKVELEVKLGEKGHGLGFLLGIPEANERKNLNDGYCLWVSSENYKNTKLLRSTVEVMNAPEVFFRRHERYLVRIEKIDNNIHFYLNDNLQFSYISHLPLTGTHVGLIARDADFEITQFTVFEGGQNIMVNCLAVPDAFLANKNYEKGLSEYRRIGYSFPGRAEGREAMFRSGVTLLEEARNTENDEEAAKLLDLALQEFEKLHATPGAPLEYLGKALVYEALKDYDEEIKCFELAYRRYPKHPLLPILQEQIVYRMYNSSHHHRLATYSFILLVVRHLQAVATSDNVNRLFVSLQKHWEHLPFFAEDSMTSFSAKLKLLQFAIPLAFWMAKPYSLVEILDDLIKLDNLSIKCIGNALYAMIELGTWKFAEKSLSKLTAALPLEKRDKLKETTNLIAIACACHSTSLEKALQAWFETKTTTKLNWEECRTLFHLLDTGIAQQQTTLILSHEKELISYEVGENEKITLYSQLIWAHLLEKNWEKAGKLLHTFPMELLTKDTTILFFLYGCWLNATGEKETAQKHFSSVLEVSYPRTWTLGNHTINGKITEGKRWFQKAFMWEKRELYRQLTLFYHCQNQPDKAKYYQLFEQKEYVNVNE